VAPIRPYTACHVAGMVHDNVTCSSRVRPPHLLALLPLPRPLAAPPEGLEARRWQRLQPGHSHPAGRAQTARGRANSWAQARAADRDSQSKAVGQAARFGPTPVGRA
jgi:hypothetical protein